MGVLLPSRRVSFCLLLTPVNLTMPPSPTKLRYHYNRRSPPYHSPTAKSIVPCLVGMPPPPSNVAHSRDNTNSPFSYLDWAGADCAVPPPLWPPQGTEFGQFTHKTTTPLQHNNSFLIMILLGGYQTILSFVSDSQINNIIDPYELLQTS